MSFSTFVGKHAAWITGGLAVALVVAILLIPALFVVGRYTAPTQEKKLADVEDELAKAKEEGDNGQKEADKAKSDHEKQLKRSAELQGQIVSLTKPPTPKPEPPKAEEPKKKVPGPDGLMGDIFTKKVVVTGGKTPVTFEGEFDDIQFPSKGLITLIGKGGNDVDVKELK